MGNVVTKLYTVVSNTNQFGLGIWNYTEEETAVNQVESLIEEYSNKENHHSVKRIGSGENYKYRGAIINSKDIRGIFEDARVEYFSNFLDNNSSQLTLGRQGNGTKEYGFNLPKTTINYLGKQGSGTSDFL